MKADPALIRNLVALLEAAAAPAARRQAITAFSNATGLSPSRAYEMAGANGWKSGRAPRADKGTWKTGVDRRAVEHAAAAIAKSKRKDRWMIMDTPTALSLLEGAGMIDPGSVAAGTMNRYLREVGLSRRQMTANHRNPGTGSAFSTPLKSLHPNHVHQFDITNCVQYFLDEKKGLGHRDMEAEFYKNKPSAFKKIRLELLRFALVDHHSGAFFVRYFYTRGERIDDVARFLWEAWSEKAGPEKYPFRGVPEILVLDRGAANISHNVQTMCGNLGVELRPHTPKNPRAKGAVESLMNIWEKKFESRLSLCAAKSLDELNAWALDYSVYANARLIHSRHRSTRSALWCSIRSDQLRTAPAWPTFQELLISRPETRTLKSGRSIEFHGNEYRIYGGVSRGERILAAFDYYRKPDIRAWKVARVDSGQAIAGEPLVARRIKLDRAGFHEDAAVIGREHKSRVHTPTQKKMAAGAKLDQSDLAAAAFGGHAAKVGKVEFIPRRGEPALEEAPATAHTRFEAEDALLRRLGRDLTAAEGAWLRTVLGETVTDAEIDSAFTALTETRRSATG